MTDADVIVVGGGPGGSTVGNLLASRGWRVILLEREQFPRYHIGESLQAGTHSIWAELGVRDKLAQAGFTVKRGATYRWGPRDEPWRITFEEEGGFPTAYQVERAKFDQILLDEAAARGADVRVRHRVTAAITEAGRLVGVRVRDAGGSEIALRGRYIVDASGQARALAAFLPERAIHRRLGRASVWTYFEGARRLEGHEGDIFIAAFDQGWFWFIPLANDVTSVGVVLGDFEGRAALSDEAAVTPGLQGLYDAMLRRCPPTHARVADARQVAPVRSMANWSYDRASATAPGLLAVGDAARFADPILSAGVFLAQSSAHVAAVALNTALREPSLERFACEFFDRWTSQTFRIHQSLAEYWYDAEGSEEDYFWHSSRLVDPDQHLTARRAFVYATSGYVGNLAERLPSGARADPENFRFLGARAPERFRDVDVEAIRRLDDEIWLASSALSRVARVHGGAPTRMHLLGETPSDPQTFIHDFRLFRVPAGHAVPARADGASMLYTFAAADPDRVVFVDLRSDDAPAYRRVGCIGFAHRRQPNECLETVLPILDALVNLAAREAPLRARESHQAMAAWLARRCASEASPVRVVPWPVREQDGRR